MVSASNHRSIRWLASGLFVATVMVASACSPDSGDAAPDPTPTSESPTTSEPTTTTTTQPTTTTTEETTTTLSPEEQDRLDVYTLHKRWMTEYPRFDERTDSWNDRAALLEELATGALLERASEAIERRSSDDGLSISQGYESNVIEIRLLGDRAEIVDCGLSQSRVESLDGEILESSGDQHILRQTNMIREGNVWKVEEFISGSRVACDPTTLPVIELDDRVKAEEP